MNEKFSPGLLENKSDIVECMMSQIEEMEGNIEKAKKGDFKVSLHRMEVRTLYKPVGVISCRYHYL